MNRNIIRKLDKIFGEGNWSDENGVIHVTGKISEAQRDALNALVTYAGEDLVVEEMKFAEQPAPAPLLYVDEANMPRHAPKLHDHQEQALGDIGDAIRAGNACMVAQRAKGLGKYGTCVENANLSALQWAEHAQQEAADGLVYTSMLMQTIERDQQRARAEVAAEILAVAENEAKSAEMRVAIISELCKSIVGGVRCKTLYVQPGLLENFNRSDVNLLTLSRVGDSLVFKTPVKVIA